MQAIYAVVEHFSMHTGQDHPAREDHQRGSGVLRYFRRGAAPDVEGRSGRTLARREDWDGLRGFPSVPCWRTSFTSAALTVILRGSQFWN